MAEASASHLFTRIIFARKTNVSLLIIKHFLHGLEDCRRKIELEKQGDDYKCYVKA